MAGAALLAGCANTVTLTPRDGGAVGMGTSRGGMGGHGVFRVDLEGRKYMGQWTVSAEGGFSGYAADSDKPLGRRQLAQARGVMNASLAGNGDGRAYAKSPDGSTLRCHFHYNGVTSIAQGLCEREDGKLYDLTVKQ